MFIWTISDAITTVIFAVFLIVALYFVVAIRIRITRCKHRAGVNETQACDAMVATKRAEIEEDKRAKPQVIESEWAIIQPQDQLAESQSSPPYKPDNREIVRAIEVMFMVGHATACEWILGVADELKA